MCRGSCVSAADGDSTDGSSELVQHSTEHDIRLTVEFVICIHTININW